MTRKHIILAGAALVLGLLLLTPVGQQLVAQTTYSVGGWLAHVTDETNDSLQVSIVSTDANQTVGGNLSVTGTSTLTGAVTASDAVTIAGDVAVDTDVLSVDTTNDVVATNGWNTFSYVTPAASSYTLASTGKAGIVEVDYTTTGTVSLILDTDLVTTPGAGAFWWIYDKDGNANSNNITISTEGSETINGAATYTMDADGEAVLLFTDGTNYYVLGGFGE